MTTRNDYQKSYPFYKLSLTPNFFYNNVLKYIMEYLINTKYHIISYKCKKHERSTRKYGSRELKPKRME